MFNIIIRGHSERKIEGRVAKSVKGSVKKRDEKRGIELGGAGRESGMGSAM